MKLVAIASMKRGLEQFVLRELSFFQESGAQIVLLPTKVGPGLYSPPSSWTVHVWTIPRVLAAQPRCLLRNPGRYLALLAVALKYRSLPDYLLAQYHSRHCVDADVIYATFGDRKFFIGYFLKRLLEKPLAVTIHAYELYRNPNSALFREALRCADLVITISEFNREILTNEYGVQRERLRVVRLGIDLEEYRPEEKLVILIVGYFAFRKGHEVLLKALKELDREDVEVWVVGGESAEGHDVDVPGLVQELGLESKVAFFGPLKGTALKAVYRASDLFCLPCRTGPDGVAEGFPSVLIEAMAMGKPIVTTDHVEIPRIVPEIVVKENDVSALVLGLRRVLDSPELRRELGRTNRSIAEEDFSEKNPAKSLELLACLTAPDGLAGPVE